MQSLLKSKMEMSKMTVKQQTRSKENQSQEQDPIPKMMNNYTDSNEFEIKKITHYQIEQSNLKPD